jgi:hypothetical protein
VKPPIWPFMWDRGREPDTRPLGDRKDMVDKYFKQTPARHDRLAATRLMQGGAILLIVALPFFLVGSRILAIVTVILGVVLLLHGRSGLLE